MDKKDFPFNVKIVVIGDDIPDSVRELAEALGGTIVGTEQMLVEPAEDCDCVPCTMRRDFEAKYPGRSPLHHPDLKLVEDEDGISVRDKVRYRLLKDPLGNTMFFNALFHPVHELNLYVCEMERMAIEDFSVEPILDDSGKVVYQIVDFTTNETFEMENVQGTLRRDSDGRTVNVTAIAGPNFDQARQHRLARVN